MLACAFSKSLPLGLACAAMLACASPSRSTPVKSSDAQETVAQLRIPALDPKRELVLGWGGTAGPPDAFATAQARLDRVYTLIELQRFDTAVVELEGLLREDLPRFGPRLTSDERLASLHASAYADELERVHAEVAAAYRKALLEGVSAWVGQPSCSMTEPHALRQGVWVPKLARFIPLSPELPHAVVGLLDVTGGRLLMISAVFAPSGAHARAPVELGVHVYDLDALGVPIQAVEDLGERRPELARSRRGVRATLAGDDVHLTFLDFEGDGELHVMVEAGVPRLLARTRSQPEEQTSAQLRHQVDVNGPHIAIDGDAVSLQPPTLNHPRVVDGNLYSDEFDSAIVEISPPHHIPKARHIEETPSGNHVLVLSHFTQTFEGDVPQPLFYALSRIDVHESRSWSGELEVLLSQGHGWTWASLGADGSVYFENWEGRLGRYPPHSGSPVWDLPDWVQVMPPCWRSPHEVTAEH